MNHAGRCYCGAIRYEVSMAPVFNLQCHCRECQYISGGAPNLCLGIPQSGFHYLAGVPKTYTRQDLEKPVTREFCGECGTHVVSRTPAAPELVLLKRGTLDEPATFGNPQVVIFDCDRQPYHLVPDGVPVFERTPG